MSRPAAAAVVLALFVLACQPREDEQSDTTARATATSGDERAILDSIRAQQRPIFARWYRGDPHAYAELFAEDLTYFSPAGPDRIDGIEALRRSYDPARGKTNRPRYEVSDEKLQLHGDVGVYTYNLDEYGTDGRVAARLNATEVYRRINGQWRIIHAHWSFRASGGRSPG